MSIVDMASQIGHSYYGTPRSKLLSILMNIIYSLLRNENWRKLHLLAHRILSVRLFVFVFRTELHFGNIESITGGDGFCCCYQFGWHSMEVCARLITLIIHPFCTCTVYSVHLWDWESLFYLKISSEICFMCTLCGKQFQAINLFGLVSHCCFL